MSGVGVPIRGETSRCRACPASVLWIRMPSGKLMPCDPVPDDEGNVAAMRDGRGVWVGHVLRADERAAPYEKRFMPHFATCVPTEAARRQAIRSGQVVDLRAAAAKGGRRHG